jgi:lysophospholipase L1-like esterase
VATHYRGLSALLGLALLGLATTAPADDKKENTATKPSPRLTKDMNPETGWMKRHEGFVEIAKKGGVDVVFLGDSITDGWRNKAGLEVWKKHFDELKPANFGIGGDRTQHVLWRIQNGELDGIKPKAAVLMIGTNNLSSNTDEEIALGIKAIVMELNKSHPETKVLLLGVFPRGEKPTDKNRDRIKTINKTIAALDDGKKVKFLDFGDKFLETDGSLSKEIMPDFLHLSSKGYQIWADNIDKPLKELAK